MNNTEATAKEPEVSSTPIITAPTTIKVKDPKRVAQGKRLAQISKEAKAAKKKRLLEEAGRSTVHEGGGDLLLSYPVLFGAIGAVVGIGGLYLTYKDSIWRKKTAVVVLDSEKSEKSGRKVKKPKEGLIDLEGFD